MSGWVLNLVTGIFENVGVVQEGMETIAQPHDIVDLPQARELIVTPGEINFDAIGFNYGSIKVVRCSLGTRHRRGLARPLGAGEKVGLIKLVRELASRPSSTCGCALTALGREGS